MHDELLNLYKLAFQYSTYHETVKEGASKIFHPITTFWNILSHILIDLPFQWLQFSSGVVGAMTSLLDISGALKGVQTEMMTSSKTMFLSFIGGRQGTIAQYSGAGLLFY